MTNTMNFGTLVNHEIKKWLSTTSFNDFNTAISERIIGQKELKTITAIVYRYLCSTAHNRTFNGNTIITAPSGSGKTETYRALQDYFKNHIPSLPVYLCDVSQITPSGFKGSDPTDILKPFMNLRIFDAIGICFLDELDKKIVPVYSENGSNINLESQSGLLSMIEGCVMHGPHGEAVNTQNIMFVGLGSFNSFRRTRSDKKSTMGFASEYQHQYNEEQYGDYVKISREDMLKAGGSNEFLGRFPFIINYKKLTEEAVISIIEQAAIRTATEFGCDIEIGDQMLHELIDSADSEFGCRLIEAKIKEAIIGAYSDAMLGFEGSSVKQLVIRINTSSDVRSKWRELTEEEIEERQEFSNPTPSVNQIQEREAVDFSWE